VAFHGLRHPTLTGAEPGQLFGVAEAGLDVPAPALAMEQHLPAPVEIIAHDVVKPALAVCGHDEPDRSVFRERHGADPGPGVARNTVARKPACPLFDRLGAVVVCDPGIPLQRAHPEDLMLVQPLRKPACIVPAIEGQVLDCLLYTS